MKFSYKNAIKLSNPSGAIKKIMSMTEEELDKKETHYKEFKETLTYYINELANQLRPYKQFRYTLNEEFLYHVDIDLDNLTNMGGELNEDVIINDLKNAVNSPILQEKATMLKKLDSFLKTAYFTTIYFSLVKFTLKTSDFVFGFQNKSQGAENSEKLLEDITMVGNALADIANRGWLVDGLNVITPHFINRELNLLIPYFVNAENYENEQFVNDKDQKTLKESKLLKDFNTSIKQVDFTVKYLSYLTFCINRYIEKEDKSVIKSLQNRSGLINELGFDRDLLAGTVLENENVKQTYSKLYENIENYSSEVLKKFGDGANTFLFGHLKTQGLFKEEEQQVKEQPKTAPEKTKTVQNKRNEEDFEIDTDKDGNYWQC
jgi:hypothetical protein